MVPDPLYLTRPVTSSVWAGWKRYSPRRLAHSRAKTAGEIRSSLL
jgi:hypothetical protein